MIGLLVAGCTCPSFGDMVVTDTEGLADCDAPAPTTGRGNPPGVDLPSRGEGREPTEAQRPRPAAVQVARVVSGRCSNRNRRERPLFELES
jgi:hypothetical protein